MSIKIITRGKGKSAVAAAAYRSGEKITNEYDGITHDYTRKGGIAHTEILLPENAPPEYSDRATLWNAVEKIEKNRNSQLAREIELALPVELSQKQNIELVRTYCQHHFVDAGMCVDICIHDKKDGNPHAHIMLTMRPFNEDKAWGSKQKKEYIFDGDGNKIYDKKKRSYKCKSVPTTDWNEQTKAEEWRSGWSDMVNQYLEKTGVAERIDHRSYERQGVAKTPTIHLGVAVFQMETRGIATERGNINRDIRVTNNQLRQLRARINKVKKWLYAQPLTDTPSMVDVMKSVADSKNLDTRWKRISDLKSQAKLLMFLQENNITDLSTLTDKVTKLHQSQYELSNTIKAQERRITMLNQHLEQVDIYKQHKAVYKKYKGLESKKQDSFYDKHIDEISAYETASKYLKDHLNGYEKVPEKAWQNELNKLLAEQYAHVEQYYRLKDDIRNVEILRRGAEAVMKQEPQVRWVQEMDL